MKKVYMCLLCGNITDCLPKDRTCSKCGFNQIEEFCMKIEHMGERVALKIANYDVLESMRKGSIWFQSPKYYQEYEGNSAICDIDECAYDYIDTLPVEAVEKQFDSLKEDIQKRLDGKFVIGNLEKAIVKRHSQHQNWLRLLCFYMLNIVDDVIIKPDEQLKEFGAYFSLVDLKTLSQKTKEAMKSRGIYCLYAPVKYVTSHYSGTYTPTLKADTYKYQNEFRFVLYGDELSNMSEKEPLKVKFEGMEDVISEPQPIEKLFEIKDKKALFDLFGITS